MLTKTPIANVTAKPLTIEVPKLKLYRIKQVILFRKDLNMRKGKIAAQVAHASMKVFFDKSVFIQKEVQGILQVHHEEMMHTYLTPEMAEWAKTSFAKVVLSVENEADLLNALKLAQKAGLPCALIIDEGNTEFHGIPTKTAVAIGPANSLEIDKITGSDGIIQTKLA